MSKYGHPVAAGICACAAVLFLPASAAAFELKHTSGGLPVRWTESTVAFVIDPSVTACATGAEQAAEAAIQAWSGASGTPVLSTSRGTGLAATKPVVDGVNTVLFAPHGYAPAGAALAITVLSFDDKTGDIVDADIILNGSANAFAVLASGARAPSGAVAVSTEGTGNNDSYNDNDDQPSSHGNAPKFDLQHVVTHELGHALGLGDVHDDATAVMYAYTMPNDASSRAPTSDDLAGVDVLYADASSTSSTPASGCGASIAATRVNPRDQWVGAAFLLGMGAWLASRSRARALVPMGAALVVLFGGSTRVHPTVDSSPRVADADATALVISATTTNVDGVFETTLELAPQSCRTIACPPPFQAQVLGGTLGDITQQVGDRPTPRVNDRVRVDFAGATPQIL